MYHRILVPIDGSATSEHALDEAIKFAQQQKAYIEVLYVMEDIMYAEADDFLNYAELVQSIRVRGEKILARAKNKLQETGIAHEEKLLEAHGDRIANIIVKEADSNLIELIIIGTHGRSGFSRILLGSVAEGVVRTAAVPVLLIRGS